MELNKNFIPVDVETKWIKHWSDKRYFSSKPDNRPAYSVVIPPPNVTGVLHMGHTLNETVQDILVRRARMTGFNACWVPGSDHASIATEAKVVHMLKEKGIDKNDLTREEFLKYAFEWKEKYGNIIYDQISRLGCSVDWDRVSFTMDDHYYESVIKTFVDLHKKGLIYRGARMINWDVAAKTALSDEEVEFKDVQGKLYHIKYLIANEDGIVAEPKAKYWTEKELITKAKKAIKDLVQKVQTDGLNTPEKLVIGKVTKEGAKLLTDLIGVEITEEFTHSIDRSSINHVIKQHGDKTSEEKRGQIAIQEKDFEKIISIISNPDEIICFGLNAIQKDTITYAKKEDDGTCIYIEEIRTGKKELMLNTMYKIKGKTGLDASLKRVRAVPTAAAVSFSETSETTYPTVKIEKVIEFSNFATDEEEIPYITVATQRPETIMGDTAVCFNPNDDRYKHLKGKKVIIPLINRAIPIIFDDYVDPAFGTGCLKVTPAHDINDYNLGLKHNLEIIDTLNDDGTISEAGKIFVGVDRFKARKLILEKLQEAGLFIQEEEYATRMGYSQRTGVVVEPKISTQWFLKMAALAKPALDAVVSGKIKIHPGDRFLATYKHWLENVKDWCISRQLWWGQQIPAWYDDNGNMVVAATEKEAQKAMSHELQAISNSSKLEAQSLKLRRDADVLDTWFSSWLWPIEVFKGITQPNNEEIKYYYPTATLVTGQDIIFFWVARMVMAGMEYMQEIPFRDVYFTGMVRDSQGRKMSKQLGNSPDLLKLIDDYGADAVRFGIMFSSPAGNDLMYDEKSLEQGKFFNNKMWNALKLVKMWEASLSTEYLVLSTKMNQDSDDENFAVAWFNSRLAQVQQEVAQLLKDFKLSEALKVIYSLIWDDFCSWYLEWVKPEYGQPIDAAVYTKTVSYFESLLELLHPFMPFVTEEIYHLLSDKKTGDDICVKQIATAATVDSAILHQGEMLKQTITAIRDVRNKQQLKPKETIQVFIDEVAKNNYCSFEHILAKQVNAAALSFTKDDIANAISIVNGKDKIFITSEFFKQDTAAQKEDLEKDLAHLKSFLVSVEKKLSNEKFVANAKPEVLAIEQKKKADAEEKIKMIEATLLQN
jgi:valyl-tRNA synthetase